MSPGRAVLITVLASWACIAVAVIAVLAVLRRRDRGGMEALIEATREDIPDYVPDEWVKRI